MEAPLEAPEKRPSVISATVEPSPIPAIAEVGFNISLIPGPPFGPSSEELARAFYVKQDMGLGGGMLVTNPIPEEFSMDADVINKAIDEAVEEANAKGIHGKETTPFLLAKIKDLTGGDSLASNIQLVYNNAKLAAATAVELSKLAKN